MIKNYLKIALRHLKKNPAYSFINIAGLAVGMACCLLISLYVLHEISYDRFHQKSDRIFRVRLDLNLNDIWYREASIPFPAAEAFKNDFPEVEEAVRMYKNIEFPLLQVGDRKFAEERFLFADPGILKVFDSPLLKGDPETALQDANSVILSQDAAQRYFGDIDPIGQTIRYANQYDLKVTGVAANVPQNSHLKFDFLAPLEFQLNIWESQTGQDGREKKWFWTGSWTYLLLSDTRAAENFNTRLPAFVSKYFPDRIKSGLELSLQPLTDIHLHSHLDNEIDPAAAGNILYVYLFSAIAVLILLIADINFVNLTTARFTSRAREVGMRKVVGAKKSQLIGQLLGEAVIASALAMLLALVLVEISLPAFNQLTGRELEFGLFENWLGMAGILGVVFTVGLLSGIYPALLLARFNPTGIIKRSLTPGSGAERFRKTLVITQFAISTILIIGIGVIYQQMQFLREKNLGFDQEQTLFVKARPEVNAKFDPFRDELLRHPGIRGVAGASNVPGEGLFAYRFIPEGGSADQPAMLPLLLVDYDFLETVGVSIQQGRGLSRTSPSDAAEGFLLNEKAVEQFGWQDNPLGKKMSLFAPGTNEIAKSGYVVGVIKDYHFESLHNEIKPMVITYNTWHSYYAIKLAAGKLSESVALIENLWRQFSPEWPIEYFFLDRKLAQLYHSEQKLAQVVNYFAALAILIAGLGLFGLSTFAAERRTREIGVRKVLGATVAGLAGLLSKDFVKLVMFANLVAWPVAYFAMNKWLQDFAYRTEINWLIFVLASGLTLAIALATVSVQAIKAALANPVKCLRYE